MMEKGNMSEYDKIMQVSIRDLLEKGSWAELVNTDSFDSVWDFLGNFGIRPNLFGNDLSGVMPNIGRVRTLLRRWYYLGSSSDANGRSEEFKNGIFKEIWDEIKELQKKALDYKKMTQSF